MQHYLTELDLSPETSMRLVKEAIALKTQRRLGQSDTLLEGKHVALYFEKPSVRTRVSFTVGVHELGGQTVELAAGNTKLGKGEEIQDFARVISRYCHLLVARVFDQSALEVMAEHASIPIVNALSDERHPCQALADMQTILEKKKQIEGIKLTYVGDGNNVAISTGLLAAALGAEVRIASPAGYEMPERFLKQADNLQGSVSQLRDAKAAVEGVDVIYTDTWVSMGQEAEGQDRRAIFAGYTVNAELLKAAKPDAIVMHCLPAVHDEEITAEVMYGAQSAIWDQAENRLHAQKALLSHLLRDASR